MDAEPIEAVDEHHRTGSSRGSRSAAPGAGGPDVQQDVVQAAQLFPHPQVVALDQESQRDERRRHRDREPGALLVLLVDRDREDRDAEEQARAMEEEWRFQRGCAPPDLDPVTRHAEHRQAERQETFDGRTSRRGDPPSPACTPGFAERGDAHEPDALFVTSPVGKSWAKRRGARNRSPCWPGSGDRRRNPAGRRRREDTRPRRGQNPSACPGREPAESSRSRRLSSPGWRSSTSSGAAGARHEIAEMMPEAVKASETGHVPSQSSSSRLATFGSRRIGNAVGDRFDAGVRAAAERVGAQDDEVASGRNPRNGGRRLRLRRSRR